MAAVFAIEVALRFDEQLHAQLRKIAGLSGSQDCAAKWQTYRYAADWLLNYADAFERGCWEFFDEPEQAAETFRDWSGALVIRRGARQQAAPAAAPFRTEPGFMTFTMACLLVAGSDAEKRMGEVCAVHESQLWMRATFVHLLRNLRAINFAHVQEDAIYVIPGAKAWALTASDMGAASFNYLRVIE
jgi:hypothetical protein